MLDQDLDPQSKIDINSYNVIRGEEVKFTSSYGSSFLVSKDEVVFVAQYFPKTTVEERGEGTSPFHSEVRSMCKLGKFNSIIGFYGYQENFVLEGFDENQSVVILEYLKYSLKDFIQKKPKIWDDTMKVKTMIGIALGMKYAHLNDVCHRNLAVSCILFDKDYNPKICNFENSKIFEEEDLESSLQQTMIGRRSFISINADDDEDEFDPKAGDVADFGTLMHCIFSGKPDFQNLSGSFRLPRIRNIKKDYWDLIQECCSSDEGARPSFSKIVKKLMDRDMWLNADQEKIEEYINTFPNDILADTDADDNDQE